MPGLRHEMLRHLLTPFAKRLWDHMAKETGWIGLSAGKLQASGDQLRAHEARRWHFGELFYVTAPMSRLALAASKSLPTFELQRCDLPSDFGVIYFSHPIGTTERSGVTIPIELCTWGQAPAELGMPNGGVWLSFYSNSDGHREDLIRRTADWPMTDAQVAAAKALSPDWAYDDEAVWQYGRDASEEAIATIETDSIAHWVTTVRTTWLLMQQEVAAVDRPPLDRHTRKRLQRSGVVDLMAPRVIALRHIHHEPTHGGGGRDYQHQWVVRGHWRKQWYRSQDRHIPIWIAPHIKGPDGAPILGGEKIYAWRR